MKYVLLITSLMATSIPVLAQNTPQVLDSFEVRAWSGGVFIQPLSPAAINPDSCLISNSYEINVSNQNNEDYMKSVALAAEISGKQLHVELNGCVNNRPLVNGLWIVD